MSNCPEYTISPPAADFAIDLAPPGPDTPSDAPASKDVYVNGSGCVCPVKDDTVHEPYVAISNAEPNPIAPGATVILKNVPPPESLRVVPPGIVTPPTVIDCVVLTDRTSEIPP